VGYAKASKRFCCIAAETFLFLAIQNQKQHIAYLVSPAGFIVGLGQQMFFQFGRACRNPCNSNPGHPATSPPLFPPLIKYGSALIAITLLCAPPAQAAGPQRVALGDAGYYVILTETGISDVAASAITGNIGTSPITGAADLLTCTEVTGHVLSVDAAGPAPCSLAKPASLTRSIGAMGTAYADAAGRTPNVNELGAGLIGGLTITPGTYKWTSNVLIKSNVTLKGHATDVWIFQVAQNVDIAASTAILLSGGAKAKNIFWQVAGSVTMGTTSHFEGIVLSKTMIAMKTGASISGRLYAQTAVTLEMNKVTAPPL
jgi:hypothetical protein